MHQSFSSVMRFDLEQSIGDSSTWHVQTLVRDKLSPLIRSPHLIGIFGAPHATVDWSVFGTSHAWKTGKTAVTTKAWLTPSVAVVDDGSSGLQFVSVSADGEVTATPIELPVVPADKSRPDQSNKLSEGNAHKKAGDFDDAVKAYGDALASTDARVSASREKLESVLLERKNETEGPRWLVWKWLRIYGLDLLIAISLAIFALVVWAKKDTVAQPFRRDPSKARWSVKMLTKPTRTLPTAGFVEEFVFGAQELATLPRLLGNRDRTDEALVRLPAENPYSFDRLQFPLDVADLFKSDKLSIGQVDIGATARVFQRLFDHFSWKLEVRVARLDSEIKAYASLRWGRDVQKMWRIPNPGDPPVHSVDEAGRILAYEVFSEGWILQ